MPGPLSAITRLFTPAQRRFRRSRPGSVLILVIALLVLMSLMGVAYVTTARVDRYSAKQNSFNTEVDLLLQGLVQLTQRNLTQAGGGPTDTSATASDTIWTSPQDTTWFGSRLPASPDPTAAPNPATAVWGYVALPQTGSTFESPFWTSGKSGAGGGSVSFSTQTYGGSDDRQNFAPTWLTLTGTNGVATYPALFDPKTNQSYLAASAAGDGIADAPLFRLPIGQLDGITYYGAVRVIDNNSAVNASVAFQADTTTLGNYTPANIDLAGLMKSPASEMESLNEYRVGPTGETNSALIDDTGMPISNYTFLPGSGNVSPDALWMQLGRRLANPGYNTASAKYQALDMTSSMALAHRFCLYNSTGSPSILETSMKPTLVSGIPTSPYAANQTSLWFANFNYANATSNPRPLLTGRNPVSNISGSRFSFKAASDAGHPYVFDATQAYTFGDWVKVAGTDGVVRSYVCMLDQKTPPSVPPTGALQSGLVWQVQPWIDYPVKTSVNTGQFGQLWQAYWSTMSETPDTPSDAASTTLFRSPLRSAVDASATDPNAPAAPSGSIQLTPTGTGDDTSYVQQMVNTSHSGDTVYFGAGTYTLSSEVFFPADRVYKGGGGGAGIASMTPSQVMRLRAALAGINSLQLRSTSNPVGALSTETILSRTISVGGAIATSPSSGTGATIAWKDGKVTDNTITMVRIDNGSNTEVTGLTFTGAGVQIENTGGMNIHDNIFRDSCRALYINGIHNGHIDNNQFLNTSQEGIYGAPGNNNTFNYNLCNNNAVDGIHLSEGGVVSGEDCSYNVVQNCGFNGIEITLHVDGLTVTHNWVQCDNMPYSIACGPKPSPLLPAGKNIKVTDNVGDYRTALYGIGVEIMGEQNLLVANNLLVGGFTQGWGITNGTSGADGVTTTGNVICSATEYGTDPLPPGYTLGPLNGSDTYTKPDNPPTIPAAPTPSSTPVTEPDNSTPALLQYRINVYGAAKQPYITQVYANNDPSTSTGYIAIELYNPYNIAIPMRNWKLATIARPASVSQLTLTELDTQGALPASIGPQQRLVLVGGTPPAGCIGPSGTPVTIPQLVKAFAQELVILRPRSASGSLSSSTDPTNTYDETNIYDLIPVDAYDFTGISSSAPAGEAVEWRYIRPNSTGKAWHFVFPMKYSRDAGTVVAADGTAMPHSRLMATMCRGYTPTPGVDLSTFGAPSVVSALGAMPLSANNTDPAYVGKDLAIEVNNTGLGGAYDKPTETKTTTSYPFGGYARNGDVLQTPFVGAYRVDLISKDATTGAYNAKIVEINSISMDSAFADDMDDTDNTAENVGRFCPISAADSRNIYDDFATNSLTPVKDSSYKWALRLFDFVSTITPHDDYLPNLPDANSAIVQPVANRNPKIRNSEADNTPLGSTEDNVGVEGLININTASWRVLATLPMPDTADHDLAKAIVLYRDGDGTDANPAHGPFQSIDDLNEVPNFRAAYQAADIANFEVPNDFQTQFLALNRISNMITTRSDTFTAYVIVQGWRGVGTAHPELVVQRRAAFVADRSAMTPTNKALIVNNVPTQ